MTGEYKISFDTERHADQTVGMDTQQAFYNLMKYRVRTGTAVRLHAWVEIKSFPSAVEITNLYG